MTYAEFYGIATGGLSPYPYQERFAREGAVVLDVPTGMGKTEATVLGWLNRRLKNPDAVPRRLMYCLPMRSLVEQTRDRIGSCFTRLSEAGLSVPRVDTVMGGEVSEAWLEKPEESCVVIGTQDMLLSRALNRGYGMSRYKWPMTFAACNDDVYWVVDEVQLQGIGAVTATQLHAFRERFGTYHPAAITLTSATIDESWFETADFTLEGKPRIALDDSDKANSMVARIVAAKKTIERANAYEAKDVAHLASERHQPGTLTLVIVNRVSRAQEIYRALARQDAAAHLVLLHSRFRPRDRAEHAAALIADVDPAGPGRIVVATQVVEAGIDVSATTLVSDVAPWASLVQRFGRCNRRGEDALGYCIWLDQGEKKRSDTQPYDADEIAEARESLLDLDGASGAPRDLPKRPIPLRTGLVLRKPELLDLFDTSSDLAGHDVDVSPYIRDSDDVAVSLFWRDQPPDDTDIPQRDELCSAPVSEIRELVRRRRLTGHGSDVRIANQFAKDSSWTELHESEIHPGILVWVRTDVGWYSKEIGFAANVAQHVPPVGHEREAERFENCPTTDGDPLSGLGVAVPLTKHSQDTLRHAQALVSAIRLADKSAAAIVERAALWHDAGKAHPVFQDTMRRANKSDATDSEIWAKGIHRSLHARRGFRHELPGALAFLAAHEDTEGANAIAYLIAAHHGKLRVAAQQFPYEAAIDPFQFMGCRNGERLPSVSLGNGMVSPECTINLSAFRIGAKNGETTWVDRTTALRDDPLLGPFRLAYLELLVRLADWRASEEERCP